MKDRFAKKDAMKVRRHRRVRAKISGTDELPRMAVSRSGRHIRVQLIDDGASKTLAAASDFELAGKGKKNATVAQAAEVGKMIAKKALEKKIAKVVFDRGGYKYHGQVKALADGAREGGLEF